MSDRMLYLLDGMALAYRGHFALMRSPRMTSKGMNASASFVFVNTLVDIIKNKGASHIAAVFDTPEPTFRHEMYPEYKAQREAMPEDLAENMPFIFKLCEAFNITVLRVPGWEADDVIGTLAVRATADKLDSVMVTPDKDYAQLVSEHAIICKPGRGGSDPEMLGVPEILEKWGIERIDQVIDILGLMGDASDNIPGVPGIGEKTAQKLIAEYGTVENLLENLEDIKGKRRENLETYRDQALLSKQLVTIALDAPVDDVSWDDLILREANTEALGELFAELEFSTLATRILGETAATPAEDSLKTIKEVSHSYETLQTAKDLAGLVKTLGGEKAFCFDLETTGLDVKTCRILGISFSIEAHKAWYVPFDDRNYDDRLAALSPLFENSDIAKIGHNLKYDIGVLSWHDVTVNGIIHDTMLAAYIAMPETRRKMDNLSRTLLNYDPIPYEDVQNRPGELALDGVNPEALAEYGAEDADVTYQLHEVLTKAVVEQGQVRVLDEIENPLVQVLVAMEKEGIRVDVNRLQEQSRGMAVEIEQTGARIFEHAGHEFNLNSPRQLGEVLFDEMQLDPDAKRTQKTGQYKTDEKVLSSLASKHAIIRDVLHYRECAKLKSTYLDALPAAIFEKTGRIHTHYEQAVTATGRMNSHDPNLQNIPIRSEAGRKVREAFVPRDDEHLLLAADYSQVELRVMAALSEDEAMIQAFKDGEDIHTATAMRIYGVEKGEVDSDMRRKAKTVNFGIIYGISAFGLSERLEVTRGESAELIEQYFELYPGVKSYMDATIEFCQENGFVQTITGRRRYLRDINSRNATTRKAAERTAINAPIQGTAADMIKIAMRSVHDAMNEAGLKSRMLLQVHDELVFDMLREEETALRALVSKEMTEALPLSVPIVVDIGVGGDWIAAH